MARIGFISLGLPRVWVAGGFALLLGVLGYREISVFGETMAPTPGGSIPAITDDQRAFFEAKIRPVLVGKCYSCHSAGAKEVEGSFLLDTRGGAQGWGEWGRDYCGEPGCLAADYCASVYQ